MPKCALLRNCPFFNDMVEDLPLVEASYKNRFCLSDNSGCARFMVASAVGRQHVPKDLFPSNTAMAEKIIQAVESQARGAPADEERGPAQDAARS